MRALLLSAGFGKRLRPLTDNIPKCLVEINGVPLLEYWLKMLTDAGIHQILVNLHYKAKKVSDYILESKYNTFVKMVYEEQLLGTGGTLLKNIDFFIGEPIMLIHADNLSLFNMSDFIRRHHERPSDTDITMMTFTTPTPESCGIVKLNEKGIVKAFFEKSQNPPGNLASAALFIMEPTVLDFLRQFNKEEIDFSAEVIPHYIGHIYTFHNATYHRDIGTIESLNTAKKEFPAIYNKYCSGLN
jgi:mannose-1-phosphate guanylyltransferase